MIFMKNQVHNIIKEGVSFWRVMRKHKNEKVGLPVKSG